MPIDLLFGNKTKQDLRCFFGNPLPKRERGLAKIDLLLFSPPLSLSKGEKGWRDEGNFSLAEVLTKLNCRLYSELTTDR